MIHGRKFIVLSAITYYATMALFIAIEGAGWSQIVVASVAFAPLSAMGALLLSIVRTPAAWRVVGEPKRLMDGHLLTCDSCGTPFRLANGSWRHHCASLDGGATWKSVDEEVNRA